MGGRICDECEKAGRVIFNKCPQPHPNQLWPWRPAFSRQMSKNKSKDKGSRFELNGAKAWTKAGYRCEKVPLSGALGGDLAGDLKLWIGQLILRGQCKCKADGWKTIYRELETHDFLEVKSDYKEPLIIMERAMLHAWLTEVALDACSHVSAPPLQTKEEAA